MPSVATRAISSRAEHVHRVEIGRLGDSSGAHHVGFEHAQFPSQRVREPRAALVGAIQQQLDDLKALGVLDDRRCTLFDARLGGAVQCCRRSRRDPFDQSLDALVAAARTLEGGGRGILLEPDDVGMQPIEVGEQLALCCMRRGGEGKRPPQRHVRGGADEEQRRRPTPTAEPCHRGRPVNTRSWLP
jgi:hypothetical protein